jgi:hypothetical protein
MGCLQKCHPADAADAKRLMQHVCSRNLQTLRATLARGTANTAWRLSPTTLSTIAIPTSLPIKLPLYETLPEMGPPTKAACMASTTLGIMDIQMVQLPNSNSAVSNAYSMLGLSNSFQDLEDPAALLESLANFEHAPSCNEANTAVSNDHFASLLQAAATATGEEAALTGHDQGRRGTIRSTTPEQIASPQSPPSSDARRKRKRHEREEQSFGFITSKVLRRSSPDDEEQRLAREREIWGPEYTEEDTPVTFEHQHIPIAGADARAAGVHSAAALFRRPSTASKKYTSELSFWRLNIYGG